MDRETFWEIVERARRAAGRETVTAEGADAVARHLVAELSAMSPAAIVGFEQAYDDVTSEGWRWDLWAAAYLMRGGCSDDGFDYFRGWLVAQGRAVWERAVADPDSLADALATLATVPTYHPSIDAWVHRAFEVLARHPDGADTLGIPPWFYGHEPPNPFATAIAKYFRNSLREAILLEICDAGIVFLPGRAGTVQEIFQDACENYYATESAVAPMVLVGHAYWTEELPAWPLLRRLARGTAMEAHVHLVETVDEAADLLV